jgi:uncharacterized protein YjdB
MDTSILSRVGGATSSGAAIAGRETAGRVARATALGAVLALGALGCNGGPIDPTAFEEGPLRVRPLLQSAVDVDLLDLDAIGVTILKIADGSTVSDTVLSYHGDPETVLAWVLDLESLPARVRVEAEAWSGDTRMFEGALETDVEDEAPQAASIIHDLDMAFVGPGAEAVSIEVTPAAPMLTFGDTLRFRVTGTDASGNTIDDVLAFWSSSDAGLAPISRDALLQAPHERGSVRVEAMTPNGLTDDVGADFQPAPATLVVVRGDGERAPVGSSLPIEVRVVGADGEGVAGVEVAFSADDVGAAVQDAQVVSGDGGGAGTTAVLGSVAGDYAFTASAPGMAPVTLTVTALPGPAEPGFATITATPSELPADGTTASTVTVRLHDANGNGLAESGGPVTLSATVGDVGVVTDHGDGTYTALLKSTEAGTALITGTLDGEPIDDSAQVTFTEVGDPGPEVAFATITADPTELPADGTTASTVTVRLFDASEEPITESGGPVTLSATVGDVGVVTDHGDGTYTALLTSTEAGTALITGTLDGEPIDDSAQVTFTELPEPEIATVHVAPSGWTLHALGDTKAYIARAFDADGVEIEGASFTWSVEDETVAEVGATTGVATALGNGTTTVTATADGVTGTATLTVEQEVASLTLERACPEGLVPCGPLASLGDEAQILAEALDANGNVVVGAEIEWSSGSATVATVDEIGVVTAVGNGTATISATAEGEVATIEVTVRQVAVHVTVEPSDVTLSVPADEPAPGPAAVIAVIPSEQQLVAQAFDANGNAIEDALFTWLSLDTAVATVDADGLVRAVDCGTTYIQATSDGVTGQATVTVQ